MQDSHLQIYSDSVKGDVKKQVEVLDGSYHKIEEIFNFWGFFLLDTLDGKLIDQKN